MTEPATAAPLSVDLVRDPARISTLRSAWETLQPTLIADSMFMTWDWFDTLLSHGPDPLAMLVFSDGDRPVAMVPVAIQGRQGLLERPSLNFGSPDYGWPNHLDFTCIPGAESSVADALVGWLRTETWSSASFRRFRGGSPVLEALAARCEEAFHVSRGVPSDSPCLQLPGSLDEFYAGLSKTFRKKLRYKVRRLSREFSVEFDFAETDREVEVTFDRLVELHRARMHERGAESHLADDPRSVEFHRAYCRKAAARGDLRLGRLTLDGKIAAISYDVRAGNTVFMYNVGFDPDARQYSPGNVLTVLAIDRYIGEGVLECDLMVGTEPYKFMWANQVRRDENLTLFPTHLEGRVRQLVHEARGKRRAKGLAEEQRLRQESTKELGSFLRVDEPPVLLYSEMTPITAMQS